MNENEYYDEIQFNEVNRIKKPRKKRHYLRNFLIFLGVLALIACFLASGFFNIKEISVEGNSYYDDDEVINIAGVRTGVNLFWGNDGSDIEKRLTENAYFTDVKLKRKLPSTLVIEVTERKQMAALVYGDKYIVIDGEGTVLRKSEIDPKVTLLSGLTISKLDVGQAVGVEEESTLQDTLAMLSVMEDGDIYFKKIDASRVVIRAYIYDTLVVKGTPKQMVKAIESGSLQKVVNNLFSNEITRGTVNLGDHDYMSFSPDF